MNEIKERLKQIQANHAQAEDDPEDRAALLRVLEDMGWLLENFHTPGMIVSAMSIANFARQVEREEIIAILERLSEVTPTFVFEGVDAEISEKMNAVVQGAVEGVVSGVIEGIKERA